MVETLQHLWELERLVALYRELKPRRVLEIGVWDGGTLERWLEGSPDLVVAVDLALRDPARWYEWADDAGADLVLVEGRSQDPDVVAEVARCGSFDWVFVDADHTAEAGRADWVNYSPLVAPGGVMVFHDIRRYEYGTLDEVWAEIQQGARTTEIHDRTGAPWGGVGIVWWP